MTDEEVIRKAVELAEGFYQEFDIWYLLKGRIRWGENTTFSSRCSFIDPPVEMLDALAAQLVRQVEVPGRLRVQVDTGFTAIRKCKSLKNGVTPTWVDLHATYGPDRTMNTIHAIVDSGVLE